MDRLAEEGHTIAAQHYNPILRALAQRDVAQAEKFLEDRLRDPRCTRHVAWQCHVASRRSQRKTHCKHDVHWWVFRLQSFIIHHSIVFYREYNASALQMRIEPTHTLPFK